MRPSRLGNHHLSLTTGIDVAKRNDDIQAGDTRDDKITRVDRTIVRIRDGWQLSEAP